MDPRQTAKRHLGWRTAGMVAVLATFLVITGGLLFALKGANQAMAKQRGCVPSGRKFDDNDKSLPALLERMRELGLPPPQIESWVSWLTFCTFAMVSVSVGVTGVGLLWLKSACTEAMISRRMRRAMGYTPADPPPPYNPASLAVNPAYPAVVVHV